MSYITVFSIYNHFKNTFSPTKLIWRDRIYLITKLNYHHILHVGKILHHIFSVSNDTAAFKLRFDTERLCWTLEEFYDAAGS